jgi:prepilin-type N-terminal cleavage/methylation domain-containing protein
MNLAPGNADRTGGFSLIEMMIVVAVIAVLAGISIPVTAAMIARARADSAGVVAGTWLESARNRAVAERRNFRVTFDTDLHHVIIERVEPDDTVTPISDYALEEDLEFLKFAGTPDTPDRFGNASEIDIEGDEPYMFTSDGSFMDTNGDPVNGTIFLGKPDQPETARAITIFGATGLIRTWKLGGTDWAQQ